MLTRMRREATIGAGGRGGFARRCTPRSASSLACALAKRLMVGSGTCPSGNGPKRAASSPCMCEPSISACPQTCSKPSWAPSASHSP
eukprot:8148377-Lingulodinium_polyedra.AAC.1